jgi:hypothetical protein
VTTNDLASKNDGSEVDLEVLRRMAQAVEARDHLKSPDLVALARQAATIIAALERAGAAYQRGREDQVAADVHTWQAAEQEMEALRQRTERAEAALREIREAQGRVCAEYDTCQHIACQSSYAAWAIADAALAEVSREPSGVGLIAAERRRQVEAEGWRTKHDDRHDRDELALAAARYALPARHRIAVAWPWDASSWRPTPDDRMRELVKAGALIAAEIDRLGRAEGRS